MMFKEMSEHRANMAAAGVAAQHVVATVTGCCIAGKMKY
jgi:hypothetical protein